MTARTFFPRPILIDHEARRCVPQVMKSVARNLDLLSLCVSASTMLDESMPNPASTVLLGPVLKSVSRSFYLTLRMLPAGMREAVGLAYLLARAADTIADTSLIAPEKRLELLLSLRNQVNGVLDEASLRLIVNEVAEQQNDSDERVLLESLGPALTLLSQLN